MDARSPYGFIENNIDTVPFEAIDEDDSIPPNTPLVKYIKLRIMGYFWRYVYWWCGFLAAPYVYVYKTLMDYFNTTVVPAITPLLTYIYTNRMTVLKYSVFIFLFISTTIWMSTIMFLYIRSTLLLKEHSISPLYFDFNKSLPTAQVSFSADSLAYGQLYSAYVDMELPESPNNLNLGMFMITLDLYSDYNNTLIWHTTRPGLLRYKTWVLRLFHTMTYSLLSLVGFYEEKQYISVELANDILPAIRSYSEVKAVVTISKPDIEIYKATIHIQASLSWFSYFVHNYPISSFLVSMPILLVVNGSIIFLIVASIFIYLSSRKGSKSGNFRSNRHLFSPTNTLSPSSSGSAGGYEEFQPILDKSKQVKPLIEEEPLSPIFSGYIPQEDPDDDEPLFNRFMSDEEDLAEVTNDDDEISSSEDLKGKKKVTFEEGRDYLAGSTSSEEGGDGDELRSSWVDVPEQIDSPSSSDNLRKRKKNTNV